MEMLDKKITIDLEDLKYTQALFYALGFIASSRHQIEKEDGEIIDVLNSFQDSPISISYKDGTGIGEMERINCDDKLILKKNTSLGELSYISDLSSPIENIIINLENDTSKKKIEISQQNGYITSIDISLFSKDELDIVEGVIFKIDSDGFHAEYSNEDIKDRTSLKRKSVTYSTTGNKFFKYKEKGYLNDQQLETKIEVTKNVPKTVLTGTIIEDNYYEDSKVFKEVEKDQISILAKQLIKYPKVTELLDFILDKVEEKLPNTKNWILGNEIFEDSGILNVQKKEKTHNFMLITKYKPKTDNPKTVLTGEALEELFNMYEVFKKEKTVEQHHEKVIKLTSPTSFSDQKLYN